MVLVWIILLQIAVFALLAYFLKVTLSKNVTQATSHLTEINQDFNLKLEEANKKKAEVEKYYDEMMLKVKSETEKTKMQILREAHDTREEMIKDARKQSGDIIDQANRSRETILADMEEKVDQRAVERAWEMVSTALPGEITKAMHERWVDSLFTANAEGLERLRLPENLQEVQVTTAHPFTAEQKKRVATLLKEKCGREVPWKENVVPELLAGFKLAFGTVVVDGSLENRMKEWARHARAAKV